MAAHSSKVNYLIVGLGIAGICLSFQLLKRNRRFRVIDGGGQSASKVAAGMYNPITGRRLVKTWKADVLFPYLHEFYQELEQHLGLRVLHPTEIYRPFKTIRERNEWESNMGSDGSGRFDGKVSEDGLYPEYHLDPFGGVAIPFSGYVDLPVLMERYRSYLRSNDLLIEGNLNPGDIKLKGGRVIFDSGEVDKVIFCDGLGGLKNGYFNWLPFQPVKGEMITIESDLSLRTIVNRGIFILPLGNGQFKVGATYDWDDTSNQTTRSARLELTGKLENLLDLDYRVIDQVAGLRPTTRDRRPFIGIHPEIEQIGIFNGLGTKGISLAPYLSGHFLDCIDQGLEINSEVNISRYFSLYFNQ